MCMSRAATSTNKATVKLLLKQPAVPPNRQKSAATRLLIAI